MGARDGQRPFPYKKRLRQISRIYAASTRHRVPFRDANCCFDIYAAGNLEPRPLASQHQFLQTRQLTGGFWPVWTSERFCDQTQSELTQKHNPALQPHDAHSWNTTCHLSTCCFYLYYINHFKTQSLLDRHLGKNRLKCGTGESGSIDASQKCPTVVVCKQSNEAWHEKSKWYYRVPANSPFLYKY